MSVTNDIVATYRGPRPVIRRLLSQGRREDQALIIVLIGCVLVFVAMTPFQSRVAHLDPAVPLQARLYWTGFFCVFVLPFVLYIVAAFSHLVARAMGGQGTGFGARMALFWALLAAAPLWLFAGLVAGFIGPGPALTITTFLAFAVFLWFWVSCLKEAQTAT